MSRMWEPFTEGARRAIVLAQAAAEKYGGRYIDTQHVLMGLLEVDKGPLLPLFDKRGLSVDAYREKLARESKASARKKASKEEFVFAPDAKRMIEAAFECAREWGTRYIATEHLVAAIERLPKSNAAKYLHELDFDLTEVAKAMRAQAIASRLREPAPAQLPHLAEENVGDDPIETLQRWLMDAGTAQEAEPTAMALSTVDDSGQSSSRMVLLRGIDERGLVFFTHYLSRKGTQLSRNNRGALLFWWPQLRRQVRIEGSVEAIGDEESDAYFASRPREHQLSAWASEQSEPLESRAALESRLEDYRARFEGDAVPRPHSWGGYRLQPQRIEFWQGRDNRLHDRLEFTKSGTTWKMQRLSP
ncbi:MAG: pyridoxamine 5'-phosphate oxidase [Candidatus Eremiobacteraeota bacterium]|nr:pyridoxamine 5'-phosphate oxidase [Candidatus Eremiobacteraeota bacterium]